MPTISVRITDEERKRLLRYGPLSDTVRDALALYLRDRQSREFVRKLRQFQQENPVKVDPDEIVRIIREGRKH
ncbi:MAG TPA: hypothetical protein VGR56_08780 [Nitrososphaerales archaeon]|nr:hypothetical protein [Nitrososphaerales archaeon]